MLLISEYTALRKVCTKLKFIMPRKTEVAFFLAKKLRRDLLRNFAIPIVIIVSGQI